ncbi:MAG: hypothetical protein KH225_03995 [Proteobacteria bacterium]|nr:hypothetical protein [Pseudomonadota bacterium]
MKRLWLWLTKPLKTPLERFFGLLFWLCSPVFLFLLLAVMFGTSFEAEDIFDFGGYPIPLPTLILFWLALVSLVLSYLGGMKVIYSVFSWIKAGSFESRKTESSSSGPRSKCGLKMFQKQYEEHGDDYLMLMAIGLAIPFCFLAVTEFPIYIRLALGGFAMLAEWFFVLTGFLATASSDFLFEKKEWYKLKLAIPLTLFSAICSLFFVGLVYAIVNNCRNLA